MNCTGRNLIALPRLQRLGWLTIDHQHHVAFQQITGFGAWMRVAPDQYVWRDLGNPDHRLGRSAGHIKLLQRDALDRRWLLRRSKACSAENERGNDGDDDGFFHGVSPICANSLSSGPTVRKASNGSPEQQIFAACGGITVFPHRLSE